MLVPTVPPLRLGVTSAKDVLALFMDAPEYALLILGLAVDPLPSPSSLRMASLVASSLCATSETSASGGASLLLIERRMEWAIALGECAIGAFDECPRRTPPGYSEADGS